MTGRRWPAQMAASVCLLDTVSSATLPHLSPGELPCPSPSLLLGCGNAPRRHRAGTHHHDTLAHPTCALISDTRQFRSLRSTYEHSFKEAMLPLPTLSAAGSPGTNSVCSRPAPLCDGSWPYIKDRHHAASFLAVS